MNVFRISDHARLILSQPIDTVTHKRHTSLHPVFLARLLADMAEFGVDWIITGFQGSLYFSVLARGLIRAKQCCIGPC